MVVLMHQSVWFAHQDVTPWDIHAWPAMTILRGKVIVEAGKLLGDLSDGKLIGHRKIMPEVLRGPAC